MLGPNRLADEEVSVRPRGLGSLRPQPWGLQPGDPRACLTAFAGNVTSWSTADRPFGVLGGLWDWPEIGTPLPCRQARSRAIRVGWFGRSPQWVAEPGCFRGGRTVRAWVAPIGRPVFEDGTLA